MSYVPADDLPTPPRGMRQLPLPITPADLGDRQPTPPRSRRPEPAEPPPIRPGGWAATPGPVDRVSFFQEQRRNRRATWRTSLACTAAILIAGIPLSLVAAPVLYPIFLVAAKLLTFVLPIRGWIVRRVEVDFPQLFIRIEAFVDAPNGPPPIVELLVLGALMVLPGILAMLLLWVALRSVFARHGVGAMLLSLGAREPRLGDLEEQQLVNVVAEMAIAAGLPPPRVLLLDSHVANAAAVGSSPDDAVVLVSRRVLDKLDRDETQGLLAHLIGSIGNGDLKIALRLVTVFRTFGLVSALLEAPTSGSARAALWRFFKLLVWPARDARAETEAVMQLLAARTSQVDSEDVDAVLGANQNKKGLRSSGVRGIFRQVRVWLLFPLWMATSLAKIMLMLLSDFALGPLVALTWRTRRSLADATAVQLTRDPDGLARALGVIGGAMPGAEWAAHLFVVGWRSTARGGLTGDGSMLSFDPPLDKRLERLRALGASVGAGRRGTARFRGNFRASLLHVFVFVPLMTLIAVLTLVALVLLLFLLLFFLIFAMIPTFVLYALLFAA